MNEEQIDVIKWTWERIQPQQSAFAATFYRKLFELDPDLRPLFPEDMAAQGEKLTKTLGVLINGLERIDDMVPLVEDLGRRHLDYGAKEEHYHKVGAALVYAVEQSVGESEWDPELQGAWSALYSLVSQVMIRGARKSRVA